jgi:hypothetical protein
MHTLHTALFLGALSLVPSLASAATLVSWGDASTYVTANQNAQGLSAAAVDYSTSSERNPVVGANYSGSNAVFYGGATSGGTGSSLGINVWRVEDNNPNFGGNDVFTFRVSTAAVGATGHALLVWKQSDFLTAATGNAAVTGFSVDARIAGAGISGEVRFMIVSNDTTLISSGQSFNSAATSTLSLASLASASWFNYNPSVSMSSIGPAFDTTGFAFDNVSMVGLLVRQQRDSGTTANMSAFWSSFSVTGDAVAPIPEPSAFALMAGLGGLAWAATRRRSRAA